MDWFTEGLPITFPLQFIVDGQSIIPDASSILVTLRGNDGAPLAGCNRLVVVPPTLTNGVFGASPGAPNNIHIAMIGPLATSLQSPSEFSTSSSLLVIPGSFNDLTPGKNFEARFLTIEYTLRGIPFSIDRRYRVTPFLTFVATKDQVRSRIGVTESELPDSEIDLHKAYFWLKAIDPLNVPNALVSDSLASLHLNTAIAIQAALDTFDALPARIMQVEKSTDASFQRSKIDLPALKYSLLTSLGAEIELMLLALSGSAYNPPISTMVSFSSGVDVITGN